MESVLSVGPPGSPPGHRVGEARELARTRSTREDTVMGFPEQQQEAPGLQAEMNPVPDCGEDRPGSTGGCNTGLLEQQ